MTITSLSVSTGPSAAGITSISLLESGTVISTANFTGTTATFSLTNTIIPANGAVTYQVEANFSTGATNSYTFNVTAGAGTNGQMVVFGNLPVAGAVVTIVAVTPTPSATPTNSLTFTPSGLGTATLTPTMTTPSLSTPMIYPNPSSGGPVKVLPLAYLGFSGIKVQIFTTAFREVQDKPYPSQAYGPVTVVLEDNWGNPLASGLYYVVITTSHGRSIAKLLILR